MSVTLFQKRNDVLLAIICCHHRRFATDVIRSTWLKDIECQCDYRFFFGRGGSGNHQPDEIVLDCDDAYRGLACKVWRICQYAQAHGYKYVFKVDDDTYTRPERVVRAGYEGKEYVGARCGPTDKYHEHPYARGGTGYWLGPKAIAALAAAPVPNPDIPSEYAEDSWVGKTTAAAGIACENDNTRLRCADFSGPGRGPRPNGYVGWKKDVPTRHNNFITSCEFLGTEMLAVHEEWVKSCDKLNALMSKLVLK